METYLKNHLKQHLHGTLNHLLPPVDPPPPDRHDFKDILIELSKNKINCMPIYKNLQGFYIQFMSQLGNHDYISHVIDRLHEKLTDGNCTYIK